MIVAKQLINSVYGIHAPTPKYIFVKNAWYKIYHLTRIANEQWYKQHYRTAHYYMKQANFIAESLRIGGAISDITCWKIRNFIETYEKV